MKRRAGVIREVLVRLQILRAGQRRMQKSSIAETGRAPIFGQLLVVDGRHHRFDEPDNRHLFCQLA